MNASAVLFGRLMLRPLLREPVRTALTTLAVALGVAVVIAIDLAGQAAAGSFHSSMESLTGQTDLVITGTGGVDEKLLARLVQLPYPFDFSPRIEDFASVNGKGEAVPFIGLDLIGHGNGDSEEHQADGTAQQLDSGSPIWVGDQFGLRKGQSVRLLINDVLRTYTIAGVLKSGKGQIHSGSFIVADIGLAQEVTGKGGRLDSIDVRLPAANTVEHWQQVLRSELPQSVTVEPRGAQTESNRKMLSAFRWNLHVRSYIALVVGAFLIYNTISISVVRRRGEIGIVRALGGTRGMVTGAFLSEALFYAVVGSGLGLLIGRLMAIAAVRLIGATVESLYVSSHPSPITLTPFAAATGVALGLAMSIFAALAPAFEAALIPPVEAMARGREQYVARVRSRRTIVWAGASLLAAAGLSQLPPIGRQPIFAYVAVLLLIGGTALAIPNIVTFFVGAMSGIAGKLLGVEATLALRSLAGSLGRTAVLTAALATAVAMTASVGIMVGSFRETVWLWMDNQLKADFYLRPAGSSGADRHPTMGADIADHIQHLPGVAAVDRFRAYPITYEGLPATLAGGESSSVGNAASTRFLRGENREQILAKLPAGDYAVVSEPFANKHRIGVGGTVSLPLAGAVRSFKVLGVYYDYSTERGYIVLDRRTLLKYLPDPAESNLAVYLKKDAKASIVREGIGGIVGGRAVLVFSNGTLRRAAIDIFDRTFRITYALEAVAIFVAVMGIAGSLLAMVLDRRREFALLRFMGGARGQIRKIILCEAGLLGLFANVIGLALGTLLSLILIFVINKQSFGWTIQFHWPVGMLLTALSGVYAATVLAGLYPSRTATQLQPIEVIHED